MEKKKFVYIKPESEWQSEHYYVEFVTYKVKLYKKGGGDMVAGITTDVNYIRKKECWWEIRSG